VQISCLYATTQVHSARPSELVVHVLTPIWRCATLLCSALALEDCLHAWVLLVAIWHCC
jgi:hypothetical protein